MGWCARVGGAARAVGGAVHGVGGAAHRGGGVARGVGGTTNGVGGASAHHADETKSAPTHCAEGPLLRGGLACIAQYVPGICVSVGAARKNFDRLTSHFSDHTSGGPPELASPEVSSCLTDPPTDRAPASEMKPCCQPSEPGGSSNLFVGGSSINRAFRDACLRLALSRQGGGSRGVGWGQLWRSSTEGRPGASKRQ